MSEDVVWAFNDRNASSFPLPTCSRFGDPVYRWKSCAI